MQRTISSFVGVFIALSTPAIAQDLNDKASATGKFRLDDSVLYYDTDNGVGDAPAEIVGDDVDKLLLLLTNNPKIETLVLNSGGGWVWAGSEMGRIVLDFGIDTHVEGECSSSCVTIFLGGQTRTMARGSKIGFHQNSWSAEGMQSYYKRWYGDEDGWETPFDFSEWLYQDVQSDTYDQLRYMIDRGVTPEFAIETKRDTRDLWFPNRRDLELAGVLRE